jgi:hypothetical protein
MRDATEGLDFDQAKLTRNDAGPRSKGSSIRGPGEAAYGI